MTLSYQTLNTLWLNFNVSQIYNQASDSLLFTSFLKLKNLYLSNAEIFEVKYKSIETKQLFKH